MSRLTHDAVRGIWAGITLTWKEDWSFDDAMLARNLERAVAAKPHGIYTTGSTGEFYALEFDEFRAMADVAAEVCGKADMPLQIGCCSDATGKTIRMLEYAASKDAVGAAQVSLPYWMELTDREMLAFFGDLYSACPDVPLVHYNIPRAKRFLTGAEYLRILEKAPSLIGSKFTFAGAYFGALQASIEATPNLSYFVAESLLVSGMLLGARGSYSSLVCTNPSWTLDMYAKADAGQWEEATEMQKHAARFFDDVEAFVEERGEGAIDPVADKGLGVAAGFVQGHQRCRPPYIGWSDATVQAVREWLKKTYPEFLYSE